MLDSLFISIHRWCNPDNGFEAFGKMINIAESTGRRNFSDTESSILKKFKGKGDSDSEYVVENRTS